MQTPINTPGNPSYLSDSGPLILYYFKKIFVLILKLWNLDLHFIRRPLKFQKQAPNLKKLKADDHCFYQLGSSRAFASVPSRCPGWNLKRPSSLKCIWFSLSFLSITMRSCKNKRKTFFLHRKRKEKNTVAVRERKQNRSDMDETEVEEGEACSYRNDNDDYDASIDLDVALSYLVRAFCFTWFFC
jgi:hypothetical protein